MECATTSRRAFLLRLHCYDEVWIVLLRHKNRDRRISRPPTHERKHSVRGGAVAAGSLYAFEGRIAAKAYVVLEQNGGLTYLHIRQDIEREHGLLACGCARGLL